VGASTPGSLEAANHINEYVTSGISAPANPVTEDSVALSRDILRDFNESG
jgi:hypothetical protein